MKIIPLILLAALLTGVSHSARAEIVKAELLIPVQRVDNLGALSGVNLPLYITAPENPGRYPLIVWSHGGLSTAQNIELVEYWAGQGFITVAPAHLDSAEQRANGASSGFPRTGNTRSFVNRVADLSSVLDAIAAVENALNTQTSGGYTIDALRPVVGGHSFGAFASMAVTGADWERSLDRRDPQVLSSDDPVDPAVIADGTLPDARFAAGIYVSPAGTEQDYGLFNFTPVDVPFLGITGTRDSGPPNSPFPSGYADRLDVFSSSAGDGIGADDGVNDEGQYMIVLQDAGHVDFLGNNNQYDADVRGVTLRFLDGVIRGNAEALVPMADPTSYATERAQVHSFFARPLIISDGGAAVFSSDLFRLPFGRVGEVYTGSIANFATAGAGETIQYAILEGPDWLVMAADGGYSGVPVPGNEGLQRVLVSATAGGGSDRAELRFFIGQAR